MALWKQAILALVVVGGTLVGWIVYVPSALPLLDRYGVIAQLERIGIEVALAENGASGGGPPFGGGSRAALVRVATVDEVIANDRVSAIGTGQALRSVSLLPETSGRLVDIFVRSGERVSQGQKIASLDATAERIAVSRAELVLDDARARAQRLQRLQGSGTATDVQIRDAELALRQAELELRQAEYDLQRREITAPIDGWVGIIGVEVGNQVTASTEITRIDDRSRLRVEFRVPERFVGRVASGQPIHASPLAQPGVRLDGQVSALDNRVDQTSRTMRVEAEIENTNDALRAGMAFNIELRFDGEAYPAVDPLAIQWSSEGAFVWAARDGHADRVPISIVQRGSDQVLIEAALDPGETVVTEGVQMLRPGAELRIAGEDTPRAATQPDGSET